MTYQSQVALVTGASSGLGAALARQLADAGARVGLVALPGEELHAQVEKIQGRGGVALAVEADVADRESIHQAVHHVERELGALDLIVPNAGVATGTPASAFSAFEFEWLMRVNYFGVIYTIEAALPGMLERGRGKIAAVSSLSSYRGAPLVSGYVASKAAVAALLEGLRVELKPRGITVTTVRPGFVRTPMSASIRSPRYMVEVEPAARAILEGVARGRAEVRFPWQARWAMTIIRNLPCGVYDGLIGRVMEDKVVEGAT
ncbi:MAG: SDR family NAD(P)-dependent oxidoreductase [Isosphaeraceae bacterium]